MSTPQAGVRLLSALRRAKSKSALYDTPSHFFVVEEERTAYEWLVDFVETHNAWPSPQTVERETGIKCIITKEPINFYREKAREHSQWEAQLPLYTEMRDAFRGQDPDKVTDLARQMITLAAEYSRGSEGLVSLKASVGMVVEDFDIAKRTPGLRGIPTGYEFMDEQTDGLQNANLYTTVARPGRGKTYKLLKQALAARVAGYSVLFLTNEMGVLQVARRFFGMETSINPRYLREGRLSSAVEAEMRRQAERMQDEDGPNFFWLAGEHGNSVEKLKAAAYASEPDLIIADASYLMKPSDRTKFNAKHEIVGDVMRGLHALGVSINRPVSQSVQFNRLASTPTKKKGEDEEDRDNPLSHMGLEKIAGTDEIGQLSAYVEGIDLGDAPNQDSERYAGALKGREGETGWYKYHYKFNPFNMEQMYDHRDRRRRGSDDDAPPPDMSFMDAA